MGKLCLHNVGTYKWKCLVAESGVQEGKAKKYGTELGFKLSTALFSLSCSPTEQNNSASVDERGQNPAGLKFSLNQT